MLRSRFVSKVAKLLTLIFILGLVVSACAPVSEPPSEIEEPEPAEEVATGATEAPVGETEEEMEVKALRFQLTKEPEVEKEPKFDSGISSGGGLSDEAFIARIGSGEIPLDNDAMARAKKLGIIR